MSDFFEQTAHIFPFDIIVREQEAPNEELDFAVATQERFFINKTLQDKVKQDARIERKMIRVIGELRAPTKHEYTQRMSKIFGYNGG